MRALGGGPVAPRVQRVQLDPVRRGPVLAWNNTAADAAGAAQGASGLRQGRGRSKKRNPCDQHRCGVGGAVFFDPGAAGRGYFARKRAKASMGQLVQLITQLCGDASPHFYGLPRLSTWLVNGSNRGGGIHGAFGSD